MRPAATHGVPEAGGGAAGLVVRGLAKRFDVDGQPLDAVIGVDLEIRPGEFFTMLGPSGCGKTTTLRMIAGLETASAGTVMLNGQDCSALPARRRNIGMVFQSYALFPHLSVFENVAYGLRLRGIPGEEVRRAVTDVLGLLQLSPYAQRLPSSLSGGQQQRVSIARALVYRPGLLLLDEPLANLDAKLRVQMREEIRRLQRRLGIMTIYVTHDQEEAMAISDRIAVFDRGRLAQLGVPAEVYAAPATLFVADFIGKANLIPVRQAPGGAALLPWGTSLSPARTFRVPAHEEAAIPAGSDGLVMVRPERLRLDPSLGLAACTVQRVQFLGSIVRYAVAVAGLDSEILVEAGRPVPGIGEGDSCRVGFAAEDAILYRRGTAA